MMPRRVKIEGDLFHQRVPDGAVKVTRPGPWGNPFPVKEHGLDHALRLFREHLDQHPDLVERARRELAGRDLACWCKPGNPCHADIWLNRISQEET